jgi:hypothetical protein
MENAPCDTTLTYLDTLETTTLPLTLTYDGGEITCFPAVPPDEPARLELVMAGMFVDLGGGWAPASLTSFGANAWVEFRGVLFPTSTSGGVVLHGDAPTWQAAAW